MSQSTSKSSKGRDTKAALSALFPRLQGQREIPGLMLLHRSRITLQPQMRSDVKTGVDELRENIASLKARRLGIEGSGILQPLLVAPDVEENGKYRLIAGERRFRASDGVCDELPVMVVNADEVAIPVLQLIENLQRRDLPPLDEAHGLQQLTDNENLSIRQAAALIGKPKSYLSDRLALLKMAPDIQEMLTQRHDTLLHARELHALSDAQQRRNLIDEITQNNLSLGELKRRISGDVAPASTSTSNPSDENVQTGHSHRQQSAKTATTAAPDDIFGALQRLAQAATTARNQLQNAQISSLQKQEFQAQIAQIEADLTEIKSHF